MKKVALIYGSWLSAPNGASKVVKTLLENNRFQQNGVELVPYTMDTIAQRDFYITGPKKKSLVTRAKELVNRLSQYFSPFAYLMMETTFLRHSRAIVSYYKNNVNDIDTVFFHDLYTCFYFLKQGCYAQRIVLVLHTNGETQKMEKYYYRSLRDNNSWGTKKLLSIYKYTIQHVDDICFVAKAPATLFCKLNTEIEQSKVHAIYNGIPDVDTLNVYANNKVKEIVCVGSVTERKGQRMLIDAICKLSEKVKPCFHVSVLGDGDIRQELEKKIQKAKLSDVVSFIGFTNQVDKYLRKADIFILPSKDEGFPMSILEAMRLSLPIISTNIAGIPEMLINNHNGVLINPCEEDIYNILLNIEKFDWAKMGVNSRQLFLSQFTIDTMIDKYSTLLNL